MNRHLDTFFERREHLIEVLTKTGQQVRAWFDARKEAEPTLLELALLEGLLAERRNHLEQLMRLDDDILNRLVAARGRQDRADAGWTRDNDEDGSVSNRVSWVGSAGDGLQSLRRLYGWLV
jgi:hypothetical protein